MHPARSGFFPNSAERPSFTVWFRYGIVWSRTGISRSRQRDSTSGDLVTTIRAAKSGPSVADRIPGNQRFSVKISHQFVGPESFSKPRCHDHTADGENRMVKVIDIDIVFGTQASRNGVDWLRRTAITRFVSNRWKMASQNSGQELSR